MKSKTRATHQSYPALDVDYRDGSLDALPLLLGDQLFVQVRGPVGHAADDLRAAQTGHQ